MKMNRRQYLGGMLAVFGAALLPGRLFATSGAFKATTIQNVMAELFPGMSVEESDAVNLRAPDIAENGAVAKAVASIAESC